VDRPDADRGRLVAGGGDHAEAAASVIREPVPAAKADSIAFGTRTRTRAALASLVDLPPP